MLTEEKPAKASRSCGSLVVLLDPISVCYIRDKYQKPEKFFVGNIECTNSAATLDIGAIERSLMLQTDI